MENEIDPFLSEIERFLAIAGISPAQFGRLALNDTVFVYDLRRGRCPGKRVRNRVYEFMKGYVRSPKTAT